MDHDAAAVITDMVNRETDAWNRRDADALVALFHPDMVWPWPPDASSIQPWKLPTSPSPVISAPDRTSLTSSHFLVQVAVPTTRALEAFVLDHIAQYPHTADVRTSLVYEHRRTTSPGPPPRGIGGTKHWRSAGPKS